jgi:hypothetical protein
MIIKENVPTVNVILEIVMGEEDAGIKLMVQTHIVGVVQVAGRVVQETRCHIKVMMGHVQEEVMHVELHQVQHVPEHVQIIVILGRAVVEIVRQETQMSRVELVAMHMVIVLKVISVNYIVEQLVCLMRQVMLMWGLVNILILLRITVYNKVIIELANHHMTLVEDILLLIVEQMVIIPKLLEWVHLLAIHIQMIGGVMHKELIKEE